MCNWAFCWWEKVYDFIYSKRGFIKLRTWRLCQWWRTSLDLSFFNYLISRDLSDTSINTNITYANLINANPLQKRISRAMTRAIWKQKIWTTQVPILNWMDAHQSSIAIVLHMTAMKNFAFLKQSFLQQYTGPTWYFTSSYNRSLWSLIHSSILDWRKHSFTVTVTTQTFPVSNHLC